MKLYLSSYHLGNDPSDLARLFESGKKVGVILNSRDFSTDEDRLEQGLKQEFSDLKNIGLEPKSLDLKKFFGKPGELESEIKKLDGLWVVGGNTFILRRAMKYSGLDEILKRLNDDFVYSGYSAGVCSITPTLKGLEFVDDPNIVPDGYESEVVWDGVGIIDYCIAPHFSSEHKESNDINKTINFYIENQILFKALRDGQAIVIDRK